MSQTAPFGGSQLGKELEELLQYLGEHPEEVLRGEQPLGDDYFLNHLSQRVGVAYEKIRYAVDNKEEHFLRRHAIRRIVKRLTIFNAEPERVVSILTRDLNRSGYLREKVLSDERRLALLLVIRAFLALSEGVRSLHDPALFLKERRYLLDLVSGAIEDALYENMKEECVVIMTAKIADRNLDAPEYGHLSFEARRKLIYIAAWRSVFAADTSLIFYKLWMLERSRWTEYSEAELFQLGKQFPKDARRLKRMIDPSLGHRLVPKLHDLTIAATLMYDALREYGPGLDAILKDRKFFAEKVGEYHRARSRGDFLRAGKRAWQAILYIFLTKSVLAAAVEFSYVVLFKEAINWVAVLLNLAIHPSLLFLLTTGLRDSGKKNREKVVGLVCDIAYGESGGQITLKNPIRGFLGDIALAFYTLLFVAVAAGIVSALHALQLHSVDIFFFIFFLVLVLYFGFRIRYGARKMVLSEESEGILWSLFELFILPFVSFGRWVSLKFDGINVVVFFLDMVIEAPLRLTLEFLDSFSLVLKEKKDEIYS